MPRSISVERTYAIKQYENIKLFDSFSLSELADLILEGTGKEVLFDNEFIDRVRLLQFVNLELAFRRYLELLKKLSDLNLEDSITFLETEKANLIDIIKESILSKFEKES